MGRPEDPIPRWVRTWMAFTAGLFFYEGLYCVLRPHSLSSGCLGSFFYVYSIYSTFDPHYADVKDSFIFAIGIGGLIESTLHLAVLLNVLKNARRTKLLAIVANIMVFWKTCLFDLYSLDVPRGGHSSEPHGWLLELLVVFVSSWTWIVVPALAAYSLARDFLQPSSKSK